MQYHKWIVKCLHCGKPRAIVNLYFTSTDTLLIETICVQCAVMAQHEISVFEMMTIARQQEAGEIVLAECASHTVN